MNTTKRSAAVTSLICLAVGAAIGVAGTKLKAGTPETTKPATTTGQNVVPLFQNPAATGQEWGQEIQDMQMQMDKMQAQMDKMLNQISAQFPSEPRLIGFPENSAYSLSLNVQDLKNRYVVRAFLPDTKVSDVNVKLENNQTLQVSVGNQQSLRSQKKNEVSTVSESGRYEQLIQLPSPVKAREMKIVRNEHELLITLPKA